MSKMPKPKSFLSRLRILPVLIVVASLGFMVRLGDAYVGLKSLSGSAYAEDAKPAEANVPKAESVGGEAGQTQPSLDKLASSKDESANDAPAKDSPIKESGAGDVTLPSAEAPVKDSSATTDSKGKDEKWKDASETDTDYADIKKEMYQDFTKRREQIELKEKKLGEREALLEAAQNELDRKYKELETLRDELKGLLKQQTAEEAARIQSLVKIYSGMKPKDAARIFDTLDTEILMEVISNMSESKASPIIATMNADRAKLLTTLLAEQKKLPEMQ